jgi:hypothetical protein
MCFFGSAIVRGKSVCWMSPVSDLDLNQYSVLLMDDTIHLGLCRRHDSQI